MRKILALLLFAINVACNSNQTVTSLDSDMPLDNMAEFISHSHNITIGYPEGWVVVDGKTLIFIAPDESSLPGNLRGDDRYQTPTYTIYTVSRHSAYGRSRLFPVSAVQKAKSMLSASTTSVDLIEPVTEVTINEFEGATYLTGVTHNRLGYTVVMNIDSDMAVVIHALGSVDKQEEMKAIVNVIALTTGKSD